MIHQKQDQKFTTKHTPLLFISLNTFEKGDWIDKKGEKNIN